MTRIEIVEEGPDRLAAYATIPIAFEVTETFDVSRSVDGLPTLTVQPATRCEVKDYDALTGNAPLEWTQRFDLRGWRFFVARIAGERVGGAVVVSGDADVDLLEARTDLGLIWDIRVARAVRRAGVGSALLAAMVDQARGSGLRELKVETQNNNVPACRFYARHGFQLRGVDRLAYPTLPDEVQLLWYRNLAAPAPSR